MDSKWSWERIKQAKPIRVLGVYLAASWFVVQGVGTLSDLVALPGWVGKVTLGLLGIGLIVVGATAWVQSLSSTTAAENRGELPSDWQIAPRDALASLRAGRLPHLTWARVLVGGVVALSLIIGAAGAWVLLQPDLNRPALPTVRGPDAPIGIAVLPFTVADPELALYREGMVSLVSTNIDGVRGFRSVSPRSVLAAWHDSFGDESNVSLDRTLQLARATGAGYALVGDIASAGGTLRLTAEVYDLSSGEPFPVGRSEGPAEEILGLIDQMSVNALRTLLAQRGGQAASEIQRLSSLLTSSIVALDAYLEGEALFRQGDYPLAIEAFERAVEADSTFAVAWSRLAGATGWLPDGSRAVIGDAQERAMRHVERLPAREVTLLSIWSNLNRAIRRGSDVQALREYVRRFPDDPAGWNLLHEYLLHLGETATPAEFDAALTRPMELDPGFESYYSHALPRFAALGDKERFDHYLGSARDAGLTQMIPRYEAIWTLLHGTSDERILAERFFQANPDEVITATDVTFLSPDLPLENALALIDVLGASNDSVAGEFESVMRVTRGTLAEGTAHPTSERVSIGAGALLAVLSGLPPTSAGAELSSDSLANLLDTLLVYRVALLDGRGLTGDSIVREAILRLAENDPDGALDILNVPDDQPIPLGVLADLWTVTVGQALTLKGDLAGAIRQYEGTTWPAFAALRLGELHEELGNTVQARENFELFLRYFAGATEEGAALKQRGLDGLARIGAGG